MSAWQFIGIASGVIILAVLAAAGLVIWAIDGMERYHRELNGDPEGIETAPTPRNPQQRVAQNDGEGWGDIGAGVGVSHNRKAP